MYRRTAAITAVLAGATALLTNTAHAESPAAQTSSDLISHEAPDDVSLRLKANGVGCPRGEYVDGRLTDDNRRIELSVGRMLAAVGPEVPATKNRSACTVMMDIRKPEGWTFAITKAEYHLFLDVGEDATATQTSTRWFQGETDSRRDSRVFEGPVDGRFRAVYRTSPGDVRWAPCDGDRLLNDTFDLRIRRGDDAERARTDFAVMHTEGDQPNAEYRLRWKRC